ncbi:MAG: sugar phosphate isomerase/epimerase [Clostridia bacterium]|nr:sugar phosphate isomerase/epimerase [Clostridia bacterium]
MATFAVSAFADEAGKSLDEQIAALVRNGLDCIEPRMIDGNGILTLPEEEIYAIRQKLDASGIKVPSLGSPIGKYPITEPFEPHLAEFRYALKVCRILGAPRMRMFSFFVEQDQLAAYKDEVIARLKMMAKEAKDAGILLCHENESRIYGQMPGQVKEILSEVPEIKGVFDAANYIMNDADVDEGMDATLPTLEYMHIKDASYAEKIILPAGEGNGKIGEMISRIDKAKNGVVILTVEPHLRLFDGFIAIDKHTLKGKYTFANATESFDFAVNSLHNVLKSLGFVKGENKLWTRK